MLKRISILLSFVVILLFLGIKTEAKVTNGELKNKYKLGSPYDGFSIICGDKDISNDLIYKIRYCVKDCTDEIISGEINYKYEILGDDSFNGSINVTYKFEDSYGTELKVVIGDIVIYDLVLDEYASIYACNIFDFMNYSENILYVGSFTYTDNYLSQYSKSIPLVFEESTKLDYLIGINAKRGKRLDVTATSKTAKDIDELYLDIEEEYGFILKYSVLDSNYYPINNEISEGEYQVKILSMDAFNEIHIDTININIIDDEHYFYCENINVNYDDPITDLMIYKYFVYFYDKDLIKTYSIHTDYKSNVNVDGEYNYTVILTDLDDNQYQSSAIIKVADFTKPILDIKCDSLGDGSYKDISEIFNIRAYDNRDLDITDKVEISDLDDYEHNYDKSGIYRFVFSVKDEGLNETTKIIDYKVEVYEEPKEEKIDEDEEKEEFNDTKPVVIKYEFNTDNQTPLTREMIRQKLIFSGFYSENDSLSMTSEYFDNKDKNGTYLIYVNSNNNVDCYSITVKDKVEASQILEEKDEVDVRFIIIASLIGLSLVGGIAFLIIKRVKKKK